ncbi:hypothetical protein PRIPAC_80409 [Pristionchus pacificus]|uniref:Uncharacterized protein n=1 Tax=Pristionchus pacificus TaxID=54126 RepID=A0A454XWL2_PRIPA|nr:hypothetical protein PRIPAC_80409 [Pristionchus pacificus]|eukprot:PDM72456.1 hypothetical protein PRIPAC_38890 [Pristionchus pacificus]
MALNVLRLVLTSIPVAVIIVLALVLRCMFMEELNEYYDQFTTVIRPVTTYFGLSAPAPPRAPLSGNHNVPRRSFMENLQNSTGASFLLKAPSRVIDV